MTKGGMSFRTYHLSFRTQWEIPRDVSHCSTWQKEVCHFEHIICHFERSEKSLSNYSHSLRSTRKGLILLINCFFLHLLKFLTFFSYIIASLISRNSLNQTNFLTLYLCEKLPGYNHSLCSVILFHKCDVTHVYNTVWFLLVSKYTAIIFIPKSILCYFLEKTDKKEKKTY